MAAVARTEVATMRRAPLVPKPWLTVAVVVSVIAVVVPHAAVAMRVRYPITCTDGDGSVIGRYALPPTVCDGDNQTDGTCTFHLSSCAPCGLGPWKCPSCPTAPIATIPIPVRTTRVVNLFDFVPPQRPQARPRRLFRLRCLAPAAG